MPGTRVPEAVTRLDTFGALVKPGLVLQVISHFPGPEDALGYGDAYTWFFCLRRWM